MSQKKQTTAGPDGLVSFGLLLIRIVIGVVMAVHGSQKLFGLFDGPGLSVFIDSIQNNLMMPAFLGYLAVLAEFGGGLALIVGLLTRLSALGIAGTMAVAVFEVHWDKGFFASIGGFEFPLTLMVVALGLVFTGAGKLSFDYFIASILDKKLPPA